MVIRSDRRVEPSAVERSVASATAGILAAAESVESHLEIVLDERAGPLTPDQRQFLDTAARHVRLLLKLVNDMRTIALAEAGTLELEWGYCDMPALVDRAVQSVWPVASVQKKTIDVDVGGAVRVLGDTVQLERALSALLEYALDHTPAGSEIRVRATMSTLEIDFETDSVADDSEPLVMLAEALAHAHGGDLVAGREDGCTNLRLSLISQGDRQEAA